MTIHKNMKTLEVKHDRYPENEIVINGIDCDFCGEKVPEDMIRSYGDPWVCDDCYEHYN